MPCCRPRDKILVTSSLMFVIHSESDDAERSALTFAQKLFVDQRRAMERR